MPENITQLIDHFDAAQRGENDPAWEARLKNEPELAAEWQTLQTALVAIREEGLREQVAAIASAFRQQQGQQAEPKPALIRRISGNLMKVAASLIIVLVITAIYKYSSVSPAGFYQKNFSGYTLSNARGATNTNAMENAYNLKDWTGVINQYNALPQKNNKARFLAAMSQLEEKRPAQAIVLFKEVLGENASGRDPYFHDESEYYLALAYLAAGEPANALPILEVIRADKNHLYNQVVSRMSWTDLKIIRYKSTK